MALFSATNGAHDSAAFFNFSNPFFHSCDTQVMLSNAEDRFEVISMLYSLRLGEDGPSTHAAQTHPRKFGKSRCRLAHAIGVLQPSAAACGLLGTPCTDTYMWFDSPVVRRGRAVRFAIDQRETLEHRAVQPNVPEHSNERASCCVQCAAAKRVVQDRSASASPLVANLQHGRCRALELKV